MFHVAFILTGGILYDSIKNLSKVSALVAIKALNGEPSPPGGNTDPGW